MRIFFFSCFDHLTGYYIYNDQVLLDRDGSGDLGPEELRKLFESSLREDDVDVLRKLRHAMESLNVNEKSGTVTFDSFRRMIEHDEMLRNIFLGKEEEDVPETIVEMCTKVFGIDVTQDYQENTIH